MSNHCYTYLYLDPRKSGKFMYDNENISFDYEPFYIGKGSENRLYSHLIEANKSDKNSHKLNKIRKIIKEGFEPIIFKFLENVSEQEAYEKEIELIWVIGRYDINMGPLTNLTWGGQGGPTGNHSKDHIEKRTNSRKENGWYKNPIETGKKISDSKTGMSIKSSPSSFKGIIYTDKERKRKYASRTGKKNPKHSEKMKEIRAVKRRQLDIIDPFITVICEYEKCGQELTMRKSKIEERYLKYDIHVCQNGCSLSLMGKRRYENLDERRKQSERQSGKNNGMFGKKHTKETKIKCGMGRKGKVPWNKI